MIISLVSAAMGIVGGLVPDIFKEIRDSREHGGELERLVVPIHENQRAALTSFAYNLGSGALKASTLLRRVNGGDWEDVPNQFLRWVYAGGRPVTGLERRRAAEVMLWLDH